MAVANVEMRVTVAEATLPLHWKIEIAVPVAAWRDLAAGAGDPQREPAKDRDGQALTVAGDLGIEPGLPSIAVMVAAISQEGDGQRHIGDAALQPPSEVDRVGT